MQDYIDGETYLDKLNQRLKQQQVFSEIEIIEFLYDLLPVLDYIHNLGVIHRDISPDNIIYRQRDKLPVLIDFGGVKEIAATVISRYSSTTIATRIGKQGYAPDEQMIRGKVSPPSDLYALAATSLTLLTGKTASTIYNPAEATWEWKKYLNLSPEFGIVIDRLLQHNPQDRYQSAAAVLADLPPLGNYPLANFPTPAPPQNAIPITNANQISQLQTLEISPRKNTPVTIPATELPERDPNEWKKPARQVTKIMSGIFVACLVIGSGVKWIKSIDPMKIVNDKINATTTGIVNSIPNPFKSQPSVQQRQQDLNQKLKQLNIPAKAFYRQVDREFYKRHPELNGRSLTSSNKDNKLRQEWQDLAVTLLAQRSR